MVKGEPMCYYCGTILWSRVDNYHTNFTNICINDSDIPAEVYQKVIWHNKDNFLQYCHKSGRLHTTKS